MDVKDFERGRFRERLVGSNPFAVLATLIGVADLLFTEPRYIPIALLGNMDLEDFTAGCFCVRLKADMVAVSAMSVATDLMAKLAEPGRTLHITLPLVPTLRLALVRSRDGSLSMEYD